MPDAAPKANNGTRFAGRVARCSVRYQRDTPWATIEAVRNSSYMQYLKGVNLSE